MRKAGGHDTGWPDGVCQNQFYLKNVTGRKDGANMETQIKNIDYDFTEKKNRLAKF